MAHIHFESVMQNLGEVIRMHRKAKGLTQGELSERIGKPQSTIARLEKMTVKDTHLSLVFQVCDALDMNASQILKEAVARSKTTQEVAHADEESRWDRMKEQVEILEKSNKKDVLQIIETALKLATASR